MTVINIYGECADRISCLTIWSSDRPLQKCSEPFGSRKSVQCTGMSEYHVPYNDCASKWFLKLL